jgi:hypothetical protein
VRLTRFAAHGLSAAAGTAAVVTAIATAFTGTGTAPSHVDSVTSVAGQPGWPRFDTAKNTTLVLRPTGNTLATDIANEHNCAFWASLAG